MTRTIAERKVQRKSQVIEPREPFPSPKYARVVKYLNDSRPALRSKTRMSIIFILIIASIISVALIVLADWSYDFH